MDNISINTNFEHNYKLHRIKFFLILSFQIPSCIVSFIIFFFFMKNQRFLRTAQNQSILLLLIINFIQLTLGVSLALLFYSSGKVDPDTSAFCQCWTFIEFTLYVISLYLMATISVQRHIIVFNGALLRIFCLRCILYYLPLSLCVVYPTIFYLVAIIFYPCDTKDYDYTNNICGSSPCYILYDPVLSLIDWWINYALPMIINIIANVHLIVRVIRQKTRLNQTLSLKQQRKLVIQVLSLATLYLLAWSPTLIVGFIQIIEDRESLQKAQYDYLIDFCYIVCLFIPWLILRLLPEVFIWLKKICPYYQHRGTTSIPAFQSVVQNQKKRFA